MIRFRNPLGTVLLIASVISSLPSQAQDRDNQANIYLGGFRYDSHHDTEMETDGGMLVGLEIPVTQRWSLSLDFWDMDTKIKHAINQVDFTFSSLNANYHLNKLGNWQPYLSLGAGKIDVDSVYHDPQLFPDETAYDFGLGLKRHLGDKFLLRSEAKAIHGRGQSGNDYALSLAIGYRLGGQKSMPVVTAPSRAPMDSDGDGVIDDRDRCADTPKDLAVDDRGCPIYETRRESQHLTVNFDYDRITVKPEYRHIIQEFAGFMDKHEDSNVTLEGHADSRGTEEYNQGLSERRAKAVKEVLTRDHGIAESRLKTRGYGENRPKAGNDTEAGMAENRRVEAILEVETREAKKRQ